MDLGVIIAVVASSISMIGVMIAMMFWVRYESNDLRKEQKDDRKDLLQISRNLENTVLSIQTEMKDFHYQLLEIGKGKK